MTDPLLEAVEDLTAPRNSRRRRKRRPMQPWEMWCSFGKHRSSTLTNLKHQYAGASICAACQMEVVENLRAVVDIPEMSEAMYIRARKRDEAARVDNKLRAHREATDPNSTGFVYYMRINGRIKIGYTANLRQRSRNYPPGTELLAIEPGTRQLEKERHDQFARTLAQGREWFAESPELRTLIDHLAKQHGVPTDAMHQYGKHEGIKHA